MYKLINDTTIQRLSDGAFIPADPANSDYQSYQAWLAAGNTPEPVAEPSTQDKIAANIAAIQSALDSGAQAHGYDSILSACSYAAQPEGAPFQAEGAAFLTWRSVVWANAYAVLAEVEAGNRALPTPEESVSMMPELVLPA